MGLVGRFSWKFCVGLLRALTAVIVALGIVAALAVWRLSSGPLGLSFAIPYIEQQIRTMAPPGTVLTLSDALLTWDSENGHAEISVRDLVLTRQSTEIVFPQLDVAVSVRGLLANRIELTDLEVVGAELSVERHEDGTFSIALFSAGGSISTLEDTRLYDGITRLLGPLNDPFGAGAKQSALAGLHSLQVSDLRLQVFDRLLGVVWNARNLNARFTRGRQEYVVSGTAELEADLFAMHTRFRAALNPVSEELALSLQSPDVDIRPLATLSDGLAPLAGVESLVSADMRMRLDGDGLLLAADLDLTLGRGLLELPPAFDARYNVAHGEVELSLRQGVLSVAVPALVLEDGVTATADIRLDDIHVPGQIDIRASVADVAVTRLRDFWPDTGQGRAKDWVAENITGGYIDRGWADIVLVKRSAATQEGDTPSWVAEKQIGGLQGIHDVTVTYMPALPPAQKASGYGEFDGTAFRLFIDSAETKGGVVLDQGLLTFSDLESDQPELDADLTLSGDIGPALALLDHPRLGYLSQLGLNRQAFGGAHRTRLRVQLPLLLDVNLEDIVVHAQSGLQGLSMIDGPFGLSVQNGQFDLDVTGAGLTVKGAATGNLGPMTVAWEQAFSETADPKATYHVQTHTSAARLSQFGLDSAGIIAGPIDVTLAMSEWRDGRYEMQLDADLTPAGLSVPQVAWVKRSGEAASLTATLTHEPGGVLRIHKLAWDSPAVRVRGDGIARFQGLGDPLALRFEEFAFLTSELRGGVLYDQSGRLVLDFSGPVFDATPFLRADTSGTGGNLQLEARVSAGQLLLDTPDPLFQGVTVTVSNLADGVGELSIVADTLNARRYVTELAAQPEATETGASGPGGSPEIPAPKPPLRLFVDVSRVDLANGVSLRGLTGSLTQKQGQWVSGVGQAMLDDGTPASHQVFFKLQDLEQQRFFELESNGAGPLLAGLDIYRGMQAGTLSMTGQILNGKPQNPLTGTVSIRDFRLVNAPVAARVLAAASLFGLVDELRGTGLAMTRLEGNFQLTGDLLEFKEVRANSPSVGVTATGAVGLQSGRLSVSGELVPVYLINNALSAIPLIGDLLAGGEAGSGILAFTYQADGEVTNPQITVNPFSGMTPGFLRRLFIPDVDQLRERVETPDTEAEKPIAAE